MILAPFYMLFLFAVAESTEKAEIYRFSDKVVAIDGETGDETTLLYPNKVTLLDEGDEIRQGSGAITECRYEDDGRLRFFSRARYRIGELTSEKHVLHAFEFTRILVQAKSDVTILLPGGTTFNTKHGNCYLEREGDLIHIRNAGAFEVFLTGHLIKEENRIVPAGQVISIPLFDPEFKDESEPIVVREVAGMIVKTTGGYSFEERPGFIVVNRPGPDDGIACIGGVRVYLLPGEAIRFRLK